MPPRLSLSSRVIDLVITFRLQAQIRQNADAIANSIVLEQGKTFAGVSSPFIRLPHDSLIPSRTDAHGDILRGLQVVETACNIPTALMGDKIEVAKDMDTETRRLPLGVCARSVSRLGRIHRGWSLTNLQHLSVQFPCVSPAYTRLPATPDCNLSG